MNYIVEMFFKRKENTMYHIEMVVDSLYIRMPDDDNLELFEACDRANIYKKKNPKATFRVINSENLDLEMEVQKPLN